MGEKRNACRLLVGNEDSVVREKNIVMGPAGPGTKNDCAGEAQQQFTRTDLEVKKT
jgi:hypothetical protein